MWRSIGGTILVTAVFWLVWMVIDLDAGTCLILYQYPNSPNIVEDLTCRLRHGY